MLRPARAAITYSHLMGFAVAQRRTPFLAKSFEFAARAQRCSSAVGAVGFRDFWGNPCGEPQSTL